MSGTGAFDPATNTGNVVAHEWNARLDVDFSIVAYTVLVYDYICTFGHEVTYVWPSPWSLGVPLFYVNRYLPMANLVIVLYLKTSEMPMKTCQIMGPMILWFSTLVLLVSQSIIALRTYALWGGRRFLFYFLLAWGLIFPGSAIVLSAITTHKALNISLPEGLGAVLTKCPTSASAGTTEALVFHLMTLAGEIIIVTLTGIKARQHMHRISPWLKQLYQSGILQCFTMLTFSIINTVVVLTGPPEFKLSIVPLQCNIHSIFCTRIILLILKNGRTASSAVRETRQTYTADIGSMFLFTSVNSIGGGGFGIETFPQRQAHSWDTRPDVEWTR